jgi:hypothetical protein
MSILFSIEGTIFSCPIFSDSSLPSFLSFAFRSLQYFRGRSVSVNISITSIMDIYHFSFSASQTERTCFSSNNFIWLIGYYYTLSMIFIYSLFINFILVFVNRHFINMLLAKTFNHGDFFFQRYVNSQFRVLYLI